MNNTLSEIERIGINVIAAELGDTPRKVKEKIRKPSMFKLSDLATLQTKFGFTDGMIRNLLQC